MEDNKTYFGEIGHGLKTLAIGDIQAQRGRQLQVYSLHIVRKGLSEWNHQDYCPHG